MVELVSAAAAFPAYIPSPPQSEWLLFGFFPLRAYAIAILIGIVVAIYIAERRMVQRGGAEGAISEVAVWAVPFGIVGGRIYHVLSSPDAYFGPDGNPMQAFKIWQGGLGIWGAVALGTVGVYLGCRRHKIPFLKALDALAPAVLVAQAIGRLGNYFNQELFGKPTTLPWGLYIDVNNRPLELVDFATFHPTFLYELLWNASAAVVLIALDSRFKWQRGQVFFAYLVAYTLGRLWIEALRVDTAELVLGLRLNIWTSLAIMAVGVIGFMIQSRKVAKIRAQSDPVE